MDFTQSHFALFGLPATYALDRDQLDSAYRDALADRALRSLHAELRRREAASASMRSPTCPACARRATGGDAAAGRGDRRVRRAGRRTTRLPALAGGRRPARPQPGRAPAAGHPATERCDQRRHPRQHQPAARAPSAGHRRRDRRGRHPLAGDAAALAARAGR